MGYERGENEDPYEENHDMVPEALGDNRFKIIHPEKGQQGERPEALLCEKEQPRSSRE